MRLVILILLILVVGGGTFLLAQTWFSLQDQQVATPAPVDAPASAELFVLVANNTIALGDLIERDDVRWQPWPEAETRPPTYFEWTEQDGDVEEAIAPLLGTVTTKNFLEGEPILSSAIVDSGERGFLAAVLRPGYRAVTVPTAQSEILDGLVHPGDYVDVILNHAFEQSFIRLDTGEEETVTHQVAETILTGVRILAIDRALDQSNRGENDVETVTLEGTPQQVETLSVADQMGSIAFVLSGIRDPDRLREEQLRIAGLTDRADVPGSAGLAPGVSLSGGGAIGAEEPAADEQALGPRAGRPDGVPLGTPLPTDLSEIGSGKPGETTLSGDLRQEIEIALNATPANLGARASLLRDPHMPVWQLERLMRRATQTSSLSSDVSLFLLAPISAVESMAFLQATAEEAEDEEDVIVVFRGSPGGQGSVEEIGVETLSGGAN